MDQKEYLKKAEKIYELIEETHNKKLDFWIENVVFTWQWWLGVFLSVVPWILWFYFRKKESTYRLLCAGFFIIFISCWFDFIGITLGLWHYNYDVLPFLPSYLPWDFTILPVIVMFLIQYKPNFNPYFKAFIFAGGSALIGEPIFEWIKIYNSEQWEYIYSFPIFFVLYLIANFISTRKEFDSLNKILD
ncbi:CBO0543 family protein [Metabacillus sp. Hm71]|uniref:CBO0543 family protein n=1 Tax=Metabacillus sp. Hm71 TaxID=3450743 RepID=UPI003F421826